jgi:hypothetical protein
MLPLRMIVKKLPVIVLHKRKFNIEGLQIVSAIPAIVRKSAKTGERVTKR